MTRGWCWILLSALACTGRGPALEPQGPRPSASATAAPRAPAHRPSRVELEAALAELFPGLHLSPPEAEDHNSAPAPAEVDLAGVAGEVAVELTTVRPDLLPACLAEPTGDCVPAALDALGARVLGRRLTAEELRALSDRYQVGASARDHRHGVSLAIAALLESPQFLYAQATLRPRRR